MTELDELRLVQFRSDLLKILGEIYAELSIVRKAVRPARLYGEGRVEELMDLIAHLIAECELNEARLDEIRKEAMAAIGAGGDND